MMRDVGSNPALGTMIEPKFTEDKRPETWLEVYFYIYDFGDWGEVDVVDPFLEGTIFYEHRTSLHTTVPPSEDVYMEEKRKALKLHVESLREKVRELGNVMSLVRPTFWSEENQAFITVIEV